MVQMNLKFKSNFGHPSYCAKSSLHFIYRPYGTWRFSRLSFYRYYVPNGTKCKPTNEGCQNTGHLLIRTCRTTLQGVQNDLQNRFTLKCEPANEGCPKRCQSCFMNNFYRNYLQRKPITHFTFERIGKNGGGSTK